MPIINPDAAVEVVEPNANGNLRESRHHVNLNARTCTCTNWIFRGIACCHALKAWDVYHAQRDDIPRNEFGRRMRDWAVDSKPWFLAAKFIEVEKLPINNKLTQENFIVIVFRLFGKEHQKPSCLEENHFEKTKKLPSPSLPLSCSQKKTRKKELFAPSEHHQCNIINAIKHFSVFTYF